MGEWKEYKASPWGIIPTHWKISSIKEETDVVTDYVANGSFASLAENVKYKSEKDYAVLIRLVDYNNQFRGDFVYIDKNAYEFLGKSKLYGDEIIISNVGANVGTVFRCPHLGCKMSLAPNSIMVKFNGNNDFYYYWLKSRFGQHMLKSIVTGSAQPKFNKTNFRDLQIPVPPIEEQEAIASILKSLDDKIEVNRKINENLEQQAQALFKSWLKDCEDEVTIGDLSLNITDYTKCEQKQVVLINSSDVTEGRFDHHNLSENKNLKGHFKKRFQKGDILYSQVRPRNRHWGYCTFNADNYLASTQLMVIRNKKEIIPSILLYQYLIDNNVWMDFTLRTETRSGTFPQGNYEDLSAIKVPFDTNVKEISDNLENIYSLIYKNVESSRRLASLRDTLLPKLMSGELKVNEL